MFFKFLLILFLVIYVIYKVGGYFLRMFVINATQQQRSFHKGQQPNASKKRAPNSNVNIDYVPKKGDGKDQQMRGGEYVDYEDVD